MINRSSTSHNYRHLLWFFALVLPAMSGCTGNQGESGGGVAPDYTANGILPLEDPAYLRAHRIRIFQKVYVGKNEQLAVMSQRKTQIRGEKGYLLDDREYDRQGNLIGWSEYGSEGIIRHAWKIDYDEQGRIIRKEGEWPYYERSLSHYKYGYEDRLEQIISRRYSDWGSEVEVEELSRDTVQIGYDKMGKERERIHWRNGKVIEKTESIYDKDGNLATWERWSDAYEHEFRERINYTRDNRGRVVEEVKEMKHLPAGSWGEEERITYDYNDAGLMSAYTRNGRQKNLEYSENGLFLGYKGETADRVHRYHFW